MNWMRQFGSLKLNIKFTLVIILFMVIPIGVLASVLFYNMEQNVIDENVNYMQYTMERNKDALSTKMESINMSTQLVLSDSEKIFCRGMVRVKKRRYYIFRAACKQ